MVYDTNTLSLYDEWKKKFPGGSYSQTMPTTATEYSPEAMTELRNAYKTEYDTGMDEAQRKLNYQFAGQGGQGFAKGAPGQYAYGNLYAQRNKDLAGFNRGLLENKLSADVRARERGETMQFDVAKMNRAADEFAMKLAGDMTMSDAEKQQAMDRFNQELAEKKREYDTTMGEEQRQYNITNFGNKEGTGTTLDFLKFGEDQGKNVLNKFGSLANLIKEGVIKGGDAAALFEPGSPMYNAITSMISTITPDADEVDPMDTYAKSKNFASAAEMNIAQTLDPERFKEYIKDPYDYEGRYELAASPGEGWEDTGQTYKDFQNSLDRLGNVSSTFKKYRKKKATWW